MKVLILFFSLFTHFSHAQLGLGGNAALFTSLGKDNCFESVMGFNVKANAKINEILVFVVEVGYFSEEQKVNETTFIRSLTPVVICFDFLLFNSKLKPYFSTNAGLYRYNLSVEDASVSTSSFGAGAGIGLRNALSNNLSIDLGSKYNLVFIDNETNTFLNSNLGLLFYF